MPELTAPQVEPEFAQRIRARGAVLDLEFARELYVPLLEAQVRAGVEVERDIAYGEDPRHRLDVYRVPGAGPLPVLLFFHGGGFIRGDKAQRENIGLCFARRGFLVALANYRLAPAHRWPAGGEDVVAACEWVRARIAAFGGDARRVCLAGESAGAAHVATALLLRRLQPRQGLSASAGVLISGVYNAYLEHLARRQFAIATPDPRNEAYFGTDFGAYRAMSLVELVDAPPVPLLITFAELDPVQMQVQAGELFARLLVHHRFECDIDVIRGHNHLTQVYSVNTADESLSGPVLRFLRQRLVESA